VGRNRGKHSRSKKNNGADLGPPVYFKNPLSDIPPEQLRKALIVHGQQSALALKSHLSDVLAILREYNPLQVLVMLSRYGLMGGMSEDGRLSPMLKNVDLLQSHVELAQALALTLPKANWVDTPPQAPVLQQLFEKLPLLARSFADQRFASVSDHVDESDQAIRRLQEHLRLHTQHVRNWGYFDRVIRIIKSLYAPLDIRIKDHVGLSVAELVETFTNRLRSFEKQANKTFGILRELLVMKTVEDCIHAYYLLCPELADKPEDLIAFAKRNSLNAEQAMGMIWAHLDYRSINDAFWDVDDLALSLGTTRDRVKTALDRMSMRAGQLAERNVEHLFLDNPVWSRPLINLSDTKYFCALPQTCFSFVRPIVDELIKDNNSLVTAVADRRAEFLEEQLAALFKDSFPGAQIVAGFRWRSEGQDFETDLLVRVDSHLFIVEAKSGVVSWPALRGAPDRAKKHIRDLIIEPSQQSERLASRIAAALKTPSLIDETLPGINIDLSLVKNVVRVSVTLDDFGTIQSNLHELRSTGWIPEGHQLAPCILFADLEVIFDLLESAGEKINYLKRRAELASSMRTIGDEMDHLGLYLKTGFNIGDEVEIGDAVLQLNSMSSVVDEYYVPLAEGFQRPKPRLRMTQWWSDICKLVEKRALWRWSEVVNILLSTSHEEQEKAEGMFRKIKRRQRNRHKSRSQDTLFVLPPKRKSEAIGLFAFRESNGAERHAKMQNVADQMFASTHVKRCLVVAVNVDSNDWPYTTMMVVDR
jgi:hypothetical protein